MASVAIPGALAADHSMWRGKQEEVEAHTQLDSVLDKMVMLRFTEENGEEKVTSLRTLCARVSSKEQTRRNFGRNIVLRETATNTEETVLCGPSEI